MDFMNRSQLRSLKSRPTVKLWKLWVFSNLAAVARSVAMCSGEHLHCRLRTRSSSAVEAGSCPSQKGCMAGSEADSEEALPEAWRPSASCRPLPGFGGMSM
jgi:hypothetical protein